VTIVRALVEDLRRGLSPDTVVTDAEALPPYGQDFREHRGTPGVVVRPHEPDDVVATLRYATASGIAVVPRAAGTNLAAGFLPNPDQILLDLRSLNRILRIDVERREAVVQPGVINGELNGRLAPLGLCYSPDPASVSISTIGGNIATNAGGPHCLKYGATYHHVRGVACALVGGDTMQLRADDAGPDLLGVIIGSEGTLAIVTEATLALRPVPAMTRTLLAAFADAEEAVHAVTAILAAGVVPAALEYADAVAIRVFDGYAPCGYPLDAGGILLVDLDGSADEVDADLPVVDDVLRGVAREVRRADDGPSRAALWRGRLHAAQAIVATGKQYLLCDATVPPTRIPALQQAIAAIAARHRLEISTLGHAGDGNLHPVILFAGDDPAQHAAAERAHEELTAAALALGGTITGEHGIGSEKRHAMAQQFRPAEIAAMRAVKAAFDPAGLLNPGIVLPEPTAEEPSLPRFAAAVRQAVDRRRNDHPWTAPIPVTPHPSMDRTAMTVDAENRTVTVGAATPLRALHDTLAAHDLDSPLPNDDATVAVVVTGNSTARPVVRDTLLAVRAVLPDGPPVRFGGSTVKDVAGYDLKRLFIGGVALFGTPQDVTFQVRAKGRRRA
jgi:glycolate oxidase